MGLTFVMIGLVIISFGIIRRIAHARAERAPRGQGTNPAPFLRTADIGILIVGMVVTILGVMVMQNVRDFDTLRSPEGIAGGNAPASRPPG